MTARTIRNAGADAPRADLVGDGTIPRER